MGHRTKVRSLIQGYEQESRGYLPKYGMQGKRNRCKVQKCLPYPSFYSIIVIVHTPAPRAYCLIMYLKYDAVTGLVLK